MSEHKATINWERNGADFGYKNYSRDHVWRFENGVETPASAAPAYLGSASTRVCLRRGTVELSHAHLSRICIEQRLRR